MENRYKQGKIYKIVCNKTGKCYIGSTCEPTLSRRLAQHRTDYNAFIKGNKKGISSFKILENNDYSIILIEDYPCERKDQLLQRERFYIENNECINRCRPITTNEEKKQQIKKWSENNKERKNKTDKEYYENNKEKLNEKFNCECGGKYTHMHRIHHLKTQKHINYCKTI